MAIITKVGKALLKKKPKVPKTASAGGGKRGNGGKKTPPVKPYMGIGEKQIEGVGDLSRPKTGRISPGGEARRQGTAKAGMSLKEKNKLAYQKGNMSKKKYFESLPANDPERLKDEWNGLLAGAKRAIKVKIMQGKKSKFAGLLQKKVIKKTGGTVKLARGRKVTTDKSKAANLQNIQSGGGPEKWHIKRIYDQLGKDFLTKSQYNKLKKQGYAKKTGGTVKRSTGGRIGMGTALRGGGAVRKR
tara:strand:+ start:98 stop:829 length:732 start_codon:yes stop_codon:yes gene_type:complete